MVTVIPLGIESSKISHPDADTFEVNSSGILFVSKTRSDPRAQLCRGLRAGRLGKRCDRGRRVVSVEEASEEPASSGLERLSELRSGHLGSIITVNPGSSWSASGRLREIRHYVKDETEPRTSVVLTWSDRNPPIVVDIESYNFVEVRPPGRFKIPDEE